MRKKMVKIILAIVHSSLLIGLCRATFWGQERTRDQCDTYMREITLEDRATVVDDSPRRLHATWLSQQCEVRAGPEYIIRKYTFYENGTFLLLRHHYAEESCSVATHTVTARGFIKLLSSSSLSAGTTEAKFQLESVHVVPLNRQVAHKFGHRLNATCSPQPKWRPYVSQLIYEPGPSRRSSMWQSSRYNSLQDRPPMRKSHGMDCLESLSIDFSELRLLRVQKRPTTSKSLSLGLDDRAKIELYLGNLPANSFAKWNHRPTFLQATALIRSDTASSCPICGSISRGTEYSPPLLHEVAALPALIGGFWTDTGCANVDGGFWMKRKLEIHSGDKLWSGRWDYYVDSKCSLFSYAITAAGSYLQRAGRQRRHEKSSVNDLEFEEYVTENPKIFDKRVHKRSLALKNIGHEIDVGLFSENKYESTDRKKKDLAEWMTPQLARKIVDLYGPRKEALADMLPSDEEMDEAIGKLVDRKEGRSFSTTFDKVQEKGSDKPGNTIDSTTGQNEGRRQKRSSDENDYRHLLQNTQPSLADSFTAMLRGNQRYEDTTRRPFTSPLPSGTTELDLHVAESFLIPGDLSVSTRCGGQRGRALSSWPRNCVPREIWSPSTLSLKAKVGVSWTGQYTLLLGLREDHIWEIPLQQCGQTSTYNPVLRAHLRTSLGIKYGLLTSSASVKYDLKRGLLVQFICVSLYYLLR